MPEVEAAPECRECHRVFRAHEDFNTCACCGDEQLCSNCENNHQCAPRGCRRCGTTAGSLTSEGPWCSPCRAEVAGGVNIDFEQGGPVKRIEHGVYGPRAEEMGASAWLAEAADDLEGLAVKLRVAAAALADADAPRAVALALMGDGLPAKWNDNTEAVEIRDLDPVKARKLVDDHGWIFKGPDFIPSEWKKMRAKDAAARV